MTAAGWSFRAAAALCTATGTDFEVFRAVEDDLVLSLQDTPQAFDTGDEIANWLPCGAQSRTHQQTAVQEMVIHSTSTNAFLAEVDGLLCACNLGPEAVRLP